jgi:hypothetical protein
MKTNDEGINRRNIPVKFMDYIAQTFGYETFGDVPKKKLGEVTDTIKMGFSQTEARIRRLYAKKAEIIKRRSGETALEFAVRVDNRDPYNDVTITQEYYVTFTPGTVPGDVMISGDAETLSLSDLKPKTVKQVAAELLEQEKSKTRSNEKLVLLGMRYGRQRIDPYATPIFDLKSFGKPIQDIGAIVEGWNVAHAKIIDFFKEILRDKVVIVEIHDEIVTEAVTHFAQRWGRMLLDGIPKKYAFKQKTGDSETFSNSNERRFWSVPETGNEMIIPLSELKIETNQQWSPEELKEWLAKPEQQNRKAYVFREDRVQPGNTNQERKPRVVTESLFTQMRNYTPDNWPADAPPYFGTEGWEFEKAMKYRQLKSMLTIEWLEKQQTEKHALVAKRLREILAA